MLLSCGLIAAVAWDVCVRQVPNWLTVALLFGGLVARALSLGAIASLWGLAGSALALALLLIPFARGWIGGGDVKLIAACGAWLGPRLTLEAIAATAIAGAVLALGYAAFASSRVRGEVLLNLKLAATTLSVPDVPQREHRAAPPYAVAIAVGTIAVILYRHGALWS